MHAFRIVIAAFVLCLANTNALAQSDSDFQIWNATISSAKLGDSPFSLFFDGHARRGSTQTTVILRPALGYRFNDTMSLWLGYAWIPVFADDPAARVDEHRIWQQFVINHNFGDERIRFQSRTRFEQRFLVDSDLGLRARQFFRFNFRPDLNHPLGVAVWDELFVGLNDPEAAVQGFDQNRIFVGAAVHTSHSVRFELGYLLAILRRPPSTIFQHALAINVFSSFEL